MPGRGQPSPPSGQTTVHTATSATSASATDWRRARSARESSTIAVSAGPSGGATMALFRGLGAGTPVAGGPSGAARETGRVGVGGAGCPWPVCAGAVGAGGCGVGLGLSGIVGTSVGAAGRCVGGAAVAADVGGARAAGAPVAGADGATVSAAPQPDRLAISSRPATRARGRIAKLHSDGRRFNHPRDVPAG